MGGPLTRLRSATSPGAALCEWMTFPYVSRVLTARALCARSGFAEPIDTYARLVTRQVLRPLGIVVDPSWVWPRDKALFTAAVLPALRRTIELGFRVTAPEAAMAVQSGAEILLTSWDWREAALVLHQAGFSPRPAPSFLVRGLPAPPRGSRGCGRRETTRRARRYAKARLLVQRAQRAIRLGPFREHEAWVIRPRGPPMVPPAQPAAAARVGSVVLPSPPPAPPQAAAPAASPAPVSAGPPAAGAGPLAAPAAPGPPPSGGGGDGLPDGQGTQSGAAAPAQPLPGGAVPADAPASAEGGVPRGSGAPPPAVSGAMLPPPPGPTPSGPRGDARTRAPQRRPAGTRRTAFDPAVAAAFGGTGAPPPPRQTTIVALARAAPPPPPAPAAPIAAAAAPAAPAANGNITSFLRPRPPAAAAPPPAVAPSAPRPAAPPPRPRRSRAQQAAVYAAIRTEYDERRLERMRTFEREARDQFGAQLMREAATTRGGRPRRRRLRRRRRRRRRVRRRRRGGRPAPARPPSGPEPPGAITSPPPPTAESGPLPLDIPDASIVGRLACRPPPPSDPPAERSARPSRVGRGDIRRLVEAGLVAECDPALRANVVVRPVSKGDGTARIVVDARLYNERWASWRATRSPLRHPTAADVARAGGPGCVGFTCDARAAFFQLRLPSSTPPPVMTWRGRRFAWRVVPMGATWAGEALADTLERELRLPRRAPPPPPPPRSGPAPMRDPTPGPVWCYADNVAVVGTPAQAAAWRARLLASRVAWKGGAIPPPSAEPFRFLGTDVDFRNRRLRLTAPPPVPSREWVPASRVAEATGWWAWAAAALRSTPPPREVLEDGATASLMDPSAMALVRRDAWVRGQETITGWWCSPPPSVAWWLRSALVFHADAAVEADYATAACVGAGTWRRVNVPADMRITAAEIVAMALAVETAPRGVPLVVATDSAAGAYIAVRGGPRGVDVASRGRHHLFDACARLRDAAAHHGGAIAVGWVPTADNVADAPSRFATPATRWPEDAGRIVGFIPRRE